MAEKHATINGREGDTIALLLVLKAHCSHVPGGDADTPSSSPSICPSAGSREAQAGAPCGPGEGEHPGTWKGRGSWQESPHIGVWERSLPRLQQPCPPARMLTPATAATAPLAARSLRHRGPHTALAVVSGRQGGPGAARGHGGPLPGLAAEPG